MPMYYRMSAQFEPPPPSEIAEVDDDDFIQDPDLFRDQLPQPFRMIDKMVTGILDDAWDIVSSREDDRLREESRVRPPQYECALQVEDTGAVNCMCVTSDGRLLIMGQTQGLKLSNAVTREPLDVWEKDDVDIIHIQTEALSDSSYILATVDDMGISRLFGIAGDNIYFLHSLNEQDGSTKLLASHCEVSIHGEYVAVCMQNAATRESWLEIHRLPREAWQKDLENLAIKAAEEKAQAANIPEIQEEGRSGETGSAEAEKPPEPQPDTSKLQSSGVGTGSSHKFTTPTMVLKVRPPAPLAGSGVSSAGQALKAVDNQGHVIGSGSSHSLHTHHLDQRQALFEQLRPSDARQGNMGSSKNTSACPTVHFLKSGQILSYGLENASTADQPNNVVIWWSGFTQISHYSLVKPAKDVEHRADVVWAVSSPVVASAVSPCTSLLAYALQEGVVVIWDCHLGIQRRVIHMEGGPASMVCFLDPLLCPQQGINWPPYSTGTNVFLLVATEDGSLTVVTCGLGDNTAPFQISDRRENREELNTLVQPMPGIPQLLVTFKESGQCYIQNVLSGEILCQVALPPEYTISTPWQPVMAVGGKGQMLYVKGSMTEDEPEHMEDENDNKTEVVQHSVFVFQLRSFPALDRYRGDQAGLPGLPFTIHSTVDVRSNVLLKERLSQQAMRKCRMEDRWVQLKQELELIKQMRDGSAKPDGLRSSVYTPQTNRLVISH